MKEQDDGKYFVDIDGVEKEWAKGTITLDELRTLGGIPAGTQVVQIDAEENEAPVAEGAIISLKPGHRFGKKVKWRRG